MNGEEAAPDAAAAPEELQALLDEAGAGTGGAAGAPEAAAEQETAEYKEILVQLLGPGFQVLAPAWAVRAEEIDALAGAYAALLEKYFPGGPGEFGPELGAALVTLGILGPRLMAGKPRTHRPGNDPQPEPDNGAH